MNKIISNGIALAIQNFRYPTGAQKYTTHSSQFMNYGIGIKDKSVPNRHDAIIDFMHNFALLDCERTIFSIMLYAAAMTLGENKFNNLIPEIRITTTLNFKSIPISLKNLVEIVKISDISDIQVGDWIYIKNHPDYLAHYPRGAASGEHVICTSTSPLLFYGLLDNQIRSIEEWITILHTNSPKLNKKEIQGILRDENRNILVRRPNFLQTKGE